MPLATKWIPEHWDVNGDYARREVTSTRSAFYAKCVLRWTQANWSFRISHVSVWNQNGALVLVVVVSCESIVREYVYYSLSQARHELGTALSKRKNSVRCLSSFHSLFSSFDESVATTENLVAGVLFGNCFVEASRPTKTGSKAVVS